MAAVPAKFVPGPILVVRGVLLFLAVPATEAAQALPPSATVTAFVDVTVLPMDRERVLPGQTVLVRAGRIAVLGPVGQVALPLEAVRVDGRGRFLLPGLADMHVHFASNDGGDGWQLNTAVSPATMLLSFLAHGVTTVRDMHSSPTRGGAAWMPHLRAQLAAGELVGPRIYAVGDPDESSPAVAARSVEALKAAGYDFVKLYGRGRPLYDSIVAAARRVGLPVVGHVPGDVGVPGVLTDRWASMEHLLGYSPYARRVAQEAGAEASDSAAALAPATLRTLAAATQRAGVWNCPTLAMLRAFDSATVANGTEDQWGRLPLPFFPPLIKALHDAGAGLLLGSDANFLVDDLLLPHGGAATHAELAALVTAGLTPYQALEMGTRNVAQFLGPADSAGTIAVGRWADLVLLRANPLLDIHNAAALAGVMVGGRWLPTAALDSLTKVVARAP